MLKAGLCLLVIPSVLIMAGYLYELSNVNECIGAGGSFDYWIGQCDFEQSHLFVPFMIRHPELVNGGMLVAVAGLALCVAGLYRRGVPNEA
jgi:hypothetical protein